MHIKGVILSFLCVALTLFSAKMWFDAFRSSILPFLCSVLTLFLIKIDSQGHGGYVSLSFHQSAPSSQSKWTFLCPETLYSANFVSSTDPILNQNGLFVNRNSILFFVWIAMTLVSFKMGSDAFRSFIMAFLCTTCIRQERASDSLNANFHDKH